MRLLAFILLVTTAVVMLATVIVTLVWMSRDAWAVVALCVWMLVVQGLIIRLQLRILRG